MVQLQNKFHLTAFGFPDHPILSHLLNQHLVAGFFFVEADYGDVALVLVPGVDDDVALVVEDAVVVVFVVVVVVVVVDGDLVAVVYGIFVVVDDDVVADVFQFDLVAVVFVDGLDDLLVGFVFAVLYSHIV